MPCSRLWRSPATAGTCRRRSAGRRWAGGAPAGRPGTAQRGAARPDGGEDPAAVRDRHDAEVRAALASGPVALVILGGAHNLADSVRRLGGDVEYVRVTTG